MRQHAHNRALLRRFYQHVDRTKVLAPVMSRSSTCSRRLTPPPNSFPPPTLFHVSTLLAAVASAFGRISPPGSSPTWTPYWRSARRT
jgi:hypothetical protein